MKTWHPLLLCAALATAACHQQTESPADPIPTAPASRPQTHAAADQPATELAPSDPGTNPEQAEPADDAPPETLTLDEQGLSFRSAPGWKKVRPKSRIVAYEFEIPRAPGDQYDGRLTITPSGGSPEEAIAARTAEFRFEQGQGPRRDALDVDGMNVTLVDLSGAWRGANFDPLPEPRPGYRMLLAIFQSPAGNVYAKLVGPAATVERHEANFNQFVKSARKRIPRRSD